MEKLILTSLFTLIINLSFGQLARLKGTAVDSISKERLTGANITLTNSRQGTSQATASGLDGTFVFNKLSKGEYQIQLAFIGYQTITRRITINDDTEELFTLSLDATNIAEINVNAQYRGTDSEARDLEKRSPNVLNVISAKQIELSPDITVANVVQRVSGLSIERNSSGDPQYAIVRGMDKRYNNTLINGIKIPSPDNENRFIPLDIFPAVFLERLEVYKSLTANMEADAIGGTVNMVMKSAPSSFLLNGDIQIGYNQMNFERNFSTYGRSQLAMQSPKELYGDEYRATPADFPTENLVLRNAPALPDIFANLTYGDRFLKDKLGVMLGGSFQNSYRPVSNYFYDPSVNSAEGNPSIMRELIERETSSQLRRLAFHGKLDYRLNENHQFSLYGGKYLLDEFRVRDQVRRESFVTTTNYSVYPITRTSNIFQDITTFDLRGTHKLTSLFNIDWSVVYSLAKNDRPDDAVFARAGTYDVASNSITNESVYFQGTRNSRTWERNSDQDLSAYLNLEYKPNIINDNTVFKFGGVARNRTRENYYNFYNYAQVFGQFRGIEWNDFSDVNFAAGMANPLGSGDRSNLTYDASEDVYAGYFNSIWLFGQTEIQAGIRAEQTIQGYEIDPLTASSNDVELSSEQRYLHFFPSVSFKQKLNTKTNLKTTYFKGISRPGFYEIVPIVRSAGGGDSFYSEEGNADLRPAIGHSVDLRYEYFPTALDQILVGAFYKRLIDPIEYGFAQVTTENPEPELNRILPQNYDNATNFGLELDATRYFNRFGIRLNYTYTNSSITTNKIVLNPGTTAPTVVNQNRPLQGQSAHVGNISFLWKDQKHHLDAQIVLNYTGERIAVVSPFLDADHLMRPMTLLDFSVEKGLKRFVLFAKVNNILNTPYELYVNKPLAVPEDPYPYQEDPYAYGNVRRDLYGASYRLGVRYSLTK